MNEESGKLYVLETQYIDLSHKLFRNSIIDGPTDIRGIITFLDEEADKEKSNAPASMASRAAKDIFYQKQRVVLDHYVCQRERLQMFMEECSSRIVDYGNIHHKLQGQTISHTQPTEMNINSRLQKVQLRFTGHFGKSLVDTLLEHEQFKVNQRNGEACWHLNSAMTEVVGNFKFPEDVPINPIYHDYYYSPDLLPPAAAAAQAPESPTGAAGVAAGMSVLSEGSAKGHHHHSHQHHSSDGNPPQHSHHSRASHGTHSEDTALPLHTSEQLRLHLVQTLQNVEVVCSASKSRKTGQGISDACAVSCAQITALVLTKLKYWHLSDEFNTFMNMNLRETEARNMMNMEETRGDNFQGGAGIAAGRVRTPGREKDIPLLLRHTFRALNAVLSTQYVARRHLYPTHNAQYLAFNAVHGRANKHKHHNHDDGVSDLAHSVHNPNPGSGDLMFELHPWNWFNVLTRVVNAGDKSGHHHHHHHNHHGQADPAAAFITGKPDHSAGAAAVLGHSSIVSSVQDEESLLNNIAFWALLIYPNIANNKYKAIGQDAATEEMNEYKQRNEQALYEFVQANKKSGGFGGTSPGGTAPSTAAAATGLGSAGVNMTMNAGGGFFSPDKPLHGGDSSVTFSSSINKANSLERSYGINSRSETVGTTVTPTVSAPVSGMLVGGGSETGSMSEVMLSAAFPPVLNDDCSELLPMRLAEPTDFTAVPIGVADGGGDVFPTAAAAAATAVGSAPPKTGVIWEPSFEGAVSVNTIHSTATTHDQVLEILGVTQSCSIALAPEYSHLLYHSLLRSHSHSSRLQSQLHLVGQQNDRSYGGSACGVGAGIDSSYMQSGAAPGMSNSYVTQVQSTSLLGGETGELEFVGGPPSPAEKLAIPTNSIDLDNGQGRGRGQRNRSRKGVLRPENPNKTDKLLLDFTLDKNILASDLCVNLLACATKSICSCMHLRCCDILTHPTLAAATAAVSGDGHGHKHGHKHGHGQSHGHRGDSGASAPVTVTAPAPGVATDAQSTAVGMFGGSTQATAPISAATSGHKGHGESEDRHGHKHKHRHGHGHGHHGHVEIPLPPVPLALQRFIDPLVDAVLCNNINICNLFALTLLDKCSYCLPIGPVSTEFDAKEAASRVYGRDPPPAFNVIPYPVDLSIGSKSVEFTFAAERAVVSILRYLVTIVNCGFISFDLVEMVASAADIVKQLNTSYPVQSAWLQVLASLASVLLTDSESRERIANKSVANPYQQVQAHVDKLMAEAQRKEKRGGHQEQKPLALDPTSPHYTVIHLPSNDASRGKEVFEKQRVLSHLQWVGRNEDVGVPVEGGGEGDHHNEEPKEKKEKKESEKDPDVPCLRTYSTPGTANASSKDLLIQFLGHYVLKDLPVVLQQHKQSTSVVYFGALILRLCCRAPFISASELDTFLNPIDTTPQNDKEDEAAASAMGGFGGAKRPPTPEKIQYQETLVPPNVTFAALLCVLLDTHIQSMQLTEQLLCTVHHFAHFSRPTQLMFIEHEMNSSILKIVEMYEGTEMFMVALSEMCLDLLVLTSDEDV